MLKHLSISNYALIDQLELDFSQKLNILTGETGAGKSIIIGAFSLVLGERADTSVLRDEENKCIVEATFDIKHFNLKPFFKKHDLDYDALTIIRREINPQGKSRAFINDTPVKLNVLKGLGNQLVDIHSQHQTLKLKDEGFRISLLDACAGTGKLLEEFKQEFSKYAAAKRKLDELQSKEADAKRDQDYLQFQFEELENAQIMEGEEEEVENELSALEHAEDIKVNLNKANYLLTENEASVETQLEEVVQLLRDSARFTDAYKNLSERLDSVLIELKDIIQELDGSQEDLEFDPDRLEELQERLDLLNRLMSKHRLQSASELLEMQKELEEKLSKIADYDGAIERAKREVSDIEAAAMNLAFELSKKRSKVASVVESRVVETLQKLGMPNAAFKVEIEKNEALHPNGIDKVEFKFSANKGETVKEIQKTASGGELSRLMLSLKNILSGMRNLPTIIFDEIDSGVSGSIGDKMGAIIQGMTDGMQVICITHLPQIAGKGTTHFQVYKEEDSKKTYTRIRELSKEERVLELAKMLSSEKPTQAALDNAKELLV